MAVNIENFRTALHGFNRTDVVQFIQAQTTEHEKALRLLREENARLQEALEAARAEAAEAKAQLEALTAAQEAAAQSAEDVPAPSEPALNAPMAPVASVVAAAPSNFNEMELAAYRRAEMTERMARERAAASAERMKTVFAQADEKLTLTSQDFATLLDAFRNDFDKMEQLLSTAQGIVDESSAGLKAAAEVAGEV
ncbi:MAG: hypothetical protein ACI3VU_03600 [Faecousia sp.]|nr:hypothetical protein [Bacillota bacterium]